jgi:hypothetical protein
VVLGASEQGLLRRIIRGTGPLEIIQDLNTSVILAEKAHQRSPADRLLGSEG